MNLYFRDNFFSAGRTDILNDKEEKVGHLDLKSAFSSAIDVYGLNSKLLYKGGFPFFSGKWVITDADGGRIGVLRSRFALFTKKFTYETEGRDSYEIVSPAFSKEYEISDESGTRVARFEQINGWFSSGAFTLNNQCSKLDIYELVAVIMGMHAIQKQNAAANNATH
ncbi:hypothetical protein [Paenibacillus aceris]|uniref:LURP-one-related family protein n=1 Tax=Paenibacillus aceris TaxID=869555 RepID=A0ABS4I0M6_9BACL|nr:hypothetical protein [Paenibacillus aceris]MBP1964365.1 hypothetical protein [Paenibacillus aceris]NHW36682.1 hypothetical protein [Paenibacillus aceris]